MQTDYANEQADRDFAVRISMIASIFIPHYIFSEIAQCLILHRFYPEFGS